MSVPKSFDELQQILLRPVETDFVDFKLRIDNTAGGRAEFVKDVLAFANTGGGVLFVGVQGATYVGVAQGEERVYDAANLHQWLRDRVSPVPVITSERLEHQGRVFFAVTINPGQQAVFLPTQTLNDERNDVAVRAGTIYVRQNTRSEPANTDQMVRKVIDSVVLGKVESEVKTRVETLQQILGQPTAPIARVEPDTASLAEWATRLSGFSVDHGHWDIRIFPVNQRRLSPPEVKDLFGFSFDRHGDNFPFLGINNDFCRVRRVATGFLAVSRIADHWNETSHFSFDGSFSSLASLLEDYFFEDRGERRMENRIVVESVVRKIALCAYYTCGLIEKRVFDGDWRIQIRLRNINGRQLYLGSGMGLWHPHVCIENEIVVEARLSLATLTQVRNIATGLASDLFAHFDWAPGSSGPIVAPMVDAHINSANLFKTDFWFKV